MKKYIQLVAVLVVAFWAQAAYGVDQHHYYWECDWNDCSFDANPLSGVSSYSWNFGDGSTFGSGVSTTHSYNLPSCGYMSTKVTLSYNFTNGTIRNVRCTIQWYEQCAGGDPGPYFFSGTCEGFN